MANLGDLVGLALTVTTQEARVEMSFSIAKQIFTQKFESPGFQIKNQINWKADAFSRAIQSKIHQKSKC